MDGGRLRRPPLINYQLLYVKNIIKIYRKTYEKYAGNGTKMNENRCPEASKKQVGGRTQCAKQRLKYLQNVPKIIENRGLEECA